jgi:hypothetical protein
MRFVLFIIVMFLFLLQACDNEEISVLQKETFIKYYGENLNDMGMKVMTVENGYVIMGNIENANRGKDICFIRTDEYGNSIAPVKVYGGIFDDNGYCMKKNSGGYIIAGSTQQSAGGKKDIFLVQVNDEGDKLWTSTIGTMEEDEASDILVLDNGSMVLTGYSDSIIPGKKDMIISRVNSAGELEWMHFIGYPEDEVGNSLALIDSMHFLIAGYTKSKPEGTTLSNIYLVVWVDKGNGVGAALPRSIEKEGNSNAVSIFPGGDSIYFVACNIQPAQQTGSKIILLKTKINEKYEITKSWERDFTGEQDYNSASSLKINNGKIFVLGTSGRTNENGDILLWSLDSAGNTLDYYNKYTGDGTSFSGNDMDFTGDGGFIITGANNLNEKSVITLIKLNSKAEL